MKLFQKIFQLLAACAFLMRGTSAWAAEPTFTFSTPDSPNMNTATGYINWAQVANSSTRLVNVFGYNSGPQQWIQLFSGSNGIVQILSGSTAANNTFTMSTSNVFTGEPLQLTNNIATIPAGIYFARMVTNSNAIFQLYDTRAHALNTAATTGIQTVSTNGAVGNMQLLPRHTFAIAANDNYSFIIQDTGMQFGMGIVIAASTTGPTYTPSQTNITICATFLP